MLSTELAFLNIGTSEMMIIIVVALLLFGGKKLPELARGLGRGIREFKDASESIKRDISDQINNFEKDIDVKDVIVEDKEPKKLNQPNTGNTGAPAGTYQHNPNPSDYYGSEKYADDYDATNDTTPADDQSVIPAVENPTVNTETDLSGQTANAPVSVNDTKDA